MIRRTVLSGLLLFTCLSFFLQGCETEVDLMAPYESTAVIIGILDYGVDTQFVRINRTYLGEGDARVYAQIKDSVEYNPSEIYARMYKKRNGEVQDSIILEYIVLPSREPGVFFNQNVGFYYTTEPLFTPEEIEDIQFYSSVANPVKMTYELKVTARGKTYTAETDFPSISGFSFIPPANPTVRPKLQLYSAANNNYRNYSFNFDTDPTGARYLGVFRINYDYSKTDGSEVSNQHIDFKVGTIDNSDLASSTVEMVLTTVNWYNNIGNVLRATPNLEKVRINHLEFRVTAANKILNTYYKIANPVSEFTPVINTYTNLDNGAIGIFASRTTAVSNYLLSEPSMKIMDEGELTVGPCYCVQNWVGSEYVCTEGVNSCP